MSSNKEIIDFLHSQGIEFANAIPFELCKVIKPYLLKETPKSVIMMLLPYYSGESDEENISLYSVPRDYHLYFKNLLTCIREHFGEDIIGFADHSPIAEVDGAAKAHLGVIGRNNLLINSKYGSYVFIGEIYTNEECDNNDTEILYCNNCGICDEKCPSKGDCLSAITQKKGELTEKEEQLIKESGCIWGCDICQKYCPHNKSVATTPINFFQNDKIFKLTEEVIENMSDEEFSNRPFSWRGKNVITRNLKIIKEESADKKD